MKSTPKISIDIHLFQKYYDLYYDSLFRFLSLYTQETDIIEDVLQDIFMKLWENKEIVEIQYIKTYLFNAAKNRILNYLRDEQNRHHLLENWFNQQQQEKENRDCFNIETFTIALNNAINQLPTQCREIFLLSRREELSYKQIAEKRNISIKTVETQIGIALKRIRNILASSSFTLLLMLLRQHYLFFL
nr:RNA polymerase sigma-70 factor [uncultured Bacteroides sp.]